MLPLASNPLVHVHKHAGKVYSYGHNKLLYSAYICDMVHVATPGSYSFSFSEVTNCMAFEYGQSPKWQKKNNLKVA